ncbi:MAG: dihydropteroate synthase [Paludibacter sp.]|nr:dihydropteroate synthase [Paludibacter sp.]
MYYCDEKPLKINNQIVNFDFPIVMGILNVTPNSFFSESRNVSNAEILHAAEKILFNGAKIIDVGGFSTRPNAEYVSENEEIRRVSIALDLILKHFPDVIVSVDTFQANVVTNLCKNFNVHIINDVGGGMWDEKMFETVARTKAVYILTHTSPTRETMMSDFFYNDIAVDVMTFFNNKIKTLNSLGINDIIIDMGFGFGKNIEQNFDLFSKIKYFEIFKMPVLVGISRKSMLQQLLNITAENSLNSTSVLNTLALVQGADILRVHDVKEAVEAVKIFKTLCVCDTI